MTNDLKFFFLNTVKLLYVYYDRNKCSDLERESPKRTCWQFHTSFLAIFR